MPPPSASSSQIATYRTTLTDAATALFTVALTASESTGGMFFGRIHADNGTDYQSLQFVGTFSAVNKAGTITAAATYDSANEAKSVSSGTLTMTFTAADSTNVLTIKVTPTGSLTETTYYIDWSCIMTDPNHFFSPS